MRLITCVVVAILAACTNETPVQSAQAGIQTMVVDGANGGNNDFFFLPPLVPNPVGSTNYDPGQFNPHLSPFVEVCELTADPRLNPLATCKPGLVFGPARMTLDGGNELYQLNWAQGSPLSLLSFYRITVRGAPGGAALGVIDVDPLFGSIKYLNSRTVPIKVRIENGAFGLGNVTDGVEQIVPSVIPGGTLDVTTNTGHAGARFSTGWLPAGIDQVVVIIERLSVNNGASETSCLQSGLEELEGCYRFRTDPDVLVPFVVPVIAGVCFQYPGDIGHHNEHPFQLHRREELQGQPVGPAFLLDEVNAPFLRCEGFGPTAPSIGSALRSGRMGDFAKAGLSAVARAIAGIVKPKALHAIDLGAGGSTNDFSRFGFARRANLTVTSGDATIAPAGSIVDAAVRVQSVHHDETSPVVGQSVTFTVTSGGGTLNYDNGTTTCTEASICTVTTDGSGNGTVSWRLGLGVNTVQVTTDRVTNSPATITATGTPPIN
jgi:hypothetical protein